MSFFYQTLLSVMLLAAFSGICFAQSTDNQNSLFTKPTDDDRPKNIKESLEKLRIDRDKKDHDEMVEHGEEAVKISTELEKSFSENGKLSEDDLTKLARVEKIVRKIRSELGGDDSDDDIADQSDQKNEKGGLAGALDSLKTRSITLYDELKKTSRFTISAAAIFSSNAVLRITKILRFGH